MILARGDLDTEKVCSWNEFLSPILTSFSINGLFNLNRCQVYVNPARPLTNGLCLMACGCVPCSNPQKKSSNYYYPLFLFIPPPQGVRAYIERKRFCRLKEAAITIQRWWRAVLERRCLRSHLAASTIQRVWRSYRARAWVRSLRDNLVQFQAHARGKFLLLFF